MINKSNNQKLFIGLLLLAALLLPLGSVMAQSNDQLELSLRQDSGYADGSKIQGIFTLAATGLSDLSRVEFYMDDIKLGEATAAPFELQFSTDAYPKEQHNLHAVGYTSSGAHIQSNILPAEFVNAVKLSSKRDFGFAAGGKIQGRFTLTATGLTELTRVEFYVDDTKMGEATSAPFKLSFSTDAYPLGQHNIYAVGFTSSGAQLKSNVLPAEFVSAQEGAQAGMSIVLPLLGVILLAVVLSVVVPMVISRGKLEKLPPGTPRKYSIFGGAICPNCKRPFAMHYYGLNVLTGKLDHCPYCGKWSVVRSVSLDRLREAEAAELVDAQAGEKIHEETEEEKLRKEIDESKYQNF